ncbi:MAG: hypothetical protein GF418_13460 [Chitinivibrionales bacterium]|nr:hypothetical protein [Chitinivibrionales bacterium]MBD3396627.1 hypothetical protein [Chitinivibrionales bacterium]
MKSKSILTAVVAALCLCSTALAEEIFTDFNRNGYRAYDGLQVGDWLYVDLSYGVTDMWSGYAPDNYMCIKTYFSDKFYWDKDFLIFTVHRDVTVLIGWPQASKHMPDWLQDGWVDNGKRGATGSYTLTFYEKEFSSGDRVQLGGNEEASFIMYTIQVETGPHDPAPWVQENVVPDTWLDGLPEPVLSEHTGWIDFYYFAWDMADTKKVHRPLGWTFDEAHGSDVSYLWDYVWMTYFTKYVQDAHPLITDFMLGIDQMYADMYPDGYAPFKWGYRRDPFWTQAPIFPMAEWQCYIHTADTDRVKRVLPYLEKNFWNVKRFWATYWGPQYFDAMIGNGMDNRPNGARIIDLTGQQAINALIISRLAEAAGDTDREYKFNKEYNFIKDVINNKMWHDGDKFYTDMKNRTGDELKSGDWTLASYWPLIAEVAPQDRVDHMVAHLNDPDNFKTAHRPPSTGKKSWAYDPGGKYWQGSVWVPTATMVIHGLTACGEHDLAREIAVNHHYYTYETYLQTGTILENYWQEGVGKPTAGSSMTDFVGWSGITPTGTLIEYVIGIKVNAPENTVTWRLRLTEQNGMRNLKWGPGFAHVMDLVADARSSESDPVTVRANSNHAFKLVVDAGFKTKTFDVAAANDQVFVVQ